MVQHWCETNLPKLPNNVHTKLTQVWVRAGFNPKMAINGEQAVDSDAYQATCYKLEFNEDLLPKREFNMNAEHRQVLGSHCTTCEGCEGILRDLELKGCRQPPMIYFKGYHDGHLIDHMAWLFERTKDANKNQAGVVLELYTKGEIIKSHTPEYDAWVLGNNGNGGAY